MNNYLFAFDSNYETQGSVAIYSLLENVSEKINIFVIRDSSNKLIRLIPKYKNTKISIKLHINFLTQMHFFTT